jgi:hypothetical protein
VTASAGIDCAWAAGAHAVMAIATLASATLVNTLRAYAKLACEDIKTRIQSMGLSCD